MRTVLLLLWVVCWGSACGPPAVDGASARRQSAPCTSSQDCSGGSACFERQCVPQGDAAGACVGDSDCGAAARCQHGACVPAQEGCRADADCRAGQVCDQGRCVADAAGCRMNSECAQGQVCRSGRCLAADTGDEGCRANSDCAEGQACRSGRCVTQQQQPPSSSGASCSTHSECPAGEACQQPEGRCTRWLGVRCDSDSPCAVSDSQGQRTPGVCDAGQCRVGPFGSCESDQACSGTLTCRTAGRNRLCLQACQTNSVCDRNLICDQEIGSCWYNLCGSPDELSDRYQSVDNGRLGGSCDADGGDDGTCVEVEAGPGQWVGLCVEGGRARVGERCRFDAARDDDRNQCQGGSLCHFDGDRDEGVCVASCSPSDAHGSVRCSGGTTCLAGRCLSREQQCDPGAQGVCGEAGRCSLLSWGLDQGMCGLQESNPGSAGAPCDKSTQCVDGSICLTLRRGEQPSTCHALCRPLEGGGSCPRNTRCTGLPELSNGQVVSDWGLCVPAAR